jgi:hypothetical protein
VASTPGANVENYFDVDYVRVTRLAPPSNQGVIGNGEGLTSVFYNQASADANTNVPQFRSEAISRITPRLNFAWDGNPDYGVGDNTGNNWGVVYQGELQAQYSESTMLTVSSHSSDGVRLWLNNQLLIDKKPVVGTDSVVESSATVPLQAGIRLPLRIEFWDGSGKGALEFRWSSASLPRQLVSPTQLYPVMLATPSLSPPPGGYTSAQTVTVTSSDPGTDMHYTLDGSEPLRSSTTIASGGTISISTSAILRVKAWRDGYWASLTAGGPVCRGQRCSYCNPGFATERCQLRSVAAANGNVADQGSSGVARVLVR